MFLLLFNLSFGGEGTPVAWDCYVQDAWLDCLGLGQRLFAMGFAQPSDAAPARVRVRIRSMPEIVGVEGFVRYTVDVFDPPQAPEPSATWSERMSGALSSTVQAQRVLDRVIVSLAPWLDVESAAGDDGTFRITLRDPATTPGDADDDDATPDDDKRAGWAFRPGLYASGSYTSNSADFNGSAYLMATWYHPDWRFSADVSGGLDYSRVSYGDIEDTYRGQSLSGSVSGMRGLWRGARRGGVSTRLSADVWTDTGVSNTRLAASADLGVEYVLFPFRVADANGNFFAQYSIGPRYLSLQVANLEGDTRLVYGQHSINVGFDWHFDAVDLSLWSGVTSNLTRPEFTTFDGSASADFRITQNLSLSPWVSASHAVARIDQPGTAQGGTLDELRASSQWTQFSLDGGLSVSLSLGAVQLAALDQRW